MKKWMLREEELIIDNKKRMEAYNNELKKSGVLDAKEEKSYKNMTKAEIIEAAKEFDVELDIKQTKAEMIEVIENL